MSNFTAALVALLAVLAVVTMLALSKVRAPDTTREQTAACEKRGGVAVLGSGTTVVCLRRDAAL